MPYQLNVNDGVDTLHIEHPWEICNSDSATDMQVVDDETAAALLATGTAKGCEHCKPEPI